MLDYLLQIIPTIADGLKVTVSLFCIVWILSIPGGILLALVRLSKFTVLDKIVEAFVYLMRGTPLMLQILFVYMHYLSLQMVLSKWMMLQQRCLHSY